MRGRVYRDTQIGREKRCAACHEWWPLDAEFYYLGDPSWCRACWAEHNRVRRPRKVAA